MAETPKNSELSKRTESWWSKNWFYITLVLVAVIGGGCAFTLPYHVQREGDNIWSLRQAILAATGGVLAILTLWENRRKNIQEKEKNDQDHTRQVHAERRARYAKAVEQLADDKSAIRLGGVYTLAKLVDDWLDDEKTLPSMEKRRQEGQIIIDSLCAYIRSSFPLAERNDELTLSYEEYQQKYQDNKQSKQSREEFLRDKSLFREEQEVRQTILSEIKKRLNGGEVKREDGKHEITPITWSYFEYDFLSTVFFYRVDFSNSYFGASSNFSGAKFTEADFSGAEFTQNANFTGAKFTEAKFPEAEFTKGTDFSGAEFTGFAYFSGAKFTEANFSWAEFTGLAYFSGAKFTKGTDFSGAKFTEANFSWAEFTQNANFTGAEFTQNANFFGAEFTEANFFGAKFTKDAHFSEAEFTQNAHFSGAKFTGKTDFDGAEFTKDAHFSEAEFTKDAHFSGAKFIDFADFSGAKFINFADFSGAKFIDFADFFGAKFTAGAYFSWAEFTEAHFSGAEFTQNANFTGAEFTQNANFTRAEFTQNANFTRAEFTEANFSWAEFTGHVDFSKATFEEKPIFEYALNSKSYKARFSCKASPEDYKFKVSSESPYKIETEEQEHNGVKFIIPKGTELFDPDDPSN